jgi:hypothetical protein
MGLFSKKPVEPELTIEQKLAASICNLGLHTALAIKQQPVLIKDAKLQEPVLTKAILEFTFVYFHLMSRSLADRMDDAKRHKYLTTILNEMKVVFPMLFSEHRAGSSEIMMQLFNATYNEAENQYAECDSFNEESTTYMEQMIGSRPTSIIGNLVNRLGHLLFGELIADDLYLMTINNIVADSYRGSSIPQNIGLLK